jgi:hypothetical protein
MENGAAAAQIIHMRKREIDGEPPPDVADVNQSLRVWLARRGLVQSEDLQKLATAAGSLPRGPVIFLTTLCNFAERRPKGDMSLPTKKETKAHGARRGPVATLEALNFCHDHIRKWRATFANHYEQGEGHCVVPRDDECPRTGNGTGTTSKGNSAGLALEGNNAMPHPSTNAQILTGKQSPFDEMEVEAELVNNLVLEVERDQNCPGHGIRDWALEAGVFRWKIYPAQIAKRKISIGNCIIRFCPEFDLGDNNVSFRIEISPHPHPDPWSTKALPSDPASRLRFRFSGITTEGKLFECYPRMGGNASVFRANSLVDLLKFVPREVIGATLRRYYYSRGQGCYTSPLDDDSAEYPMDDDDT